MANGFASKLLLDLTAELLSRGTTVRFRPSGRSMYPSIREGELITVEPVQPSDVKLGDIVLYRSQRGLVAHRVVGSSPTQSSVLSPHYFLRGDASLSCDKPIEVQQILGRVVSVEREGRAINLAGTPAKRWHRARRLASRLKGWIYPVGSGSYPNLTNELLSRGATVRFPTSGTSPTQSSVLSPHLAAWPGG